MSYLYEEIDSLRKYGIVKKLPKYIIDNLSSAMILRPYQVNAFENFITWYESGQKPLPTQCLFHMATGSGKTLIMAGLMLYLYKQGYRNFLFFVNSKNIVEKTKDNFLKTNYCKYLFDKNIMIDGENVQIVEVQNFQSVDSNAINICFTTTQGLNQDMWTAKEGKISFDDFNDQKIVLISDEAHHLNASTKKMNKVEEENYHSWENTVKNIFYANKDNVLLEFTATCDITNPLINAEYKNKIVFNYPLYNFKEDKYSKEIKTLRCDLPLWDRVIQAIVLSQYRMKIFQDYRINIKPIVLFKSSKINESKTNLALFIEKVENLTAKEIERISKLAKPETIMKKAWDYFYKNNILFEQLAEEIKDDFGIEHCISVNDDIEAESKQRILNNLEDKENPYRAIFEVKKLDEGWDVLNLYDIVRMYDTRQGGGKISPSTVSEAQLIGRGARYCPFIIDNDQDRYKRKYDDDLDNELRVCEELYYHCYNESRYISELNTALKEIGLDQDNVVIREYKIKESFKEDLLYKNGFVFTNDRTVESRKNVNELLPSTRNKIYTYAIASGYSTEDTMLSDDKITNKNNKNMTIKRMTLSEMANRNYAIIQRAMCHYRIFQFNILKSYFPNLSSTKEFVFSDKYLGGIIVEVATIKDKLTCNDLYDTCVYVLGKIANDISAIEETYSGTHEFRAHYIHDIFKDKKGIYTDPHDGGVGVSQNDSSVPFFIKMDLSKEDWFVFEDNYGTSEEKMFVAYFKTYVEKLKGKYDKVYLIRNERQLKLYSFHGGERFEPDYVLFLQSNNCDGYEQLQVFIEPKGTHLLECDSWKENFLLQIKKESIPITTFVDDNQYKIWGFHFFNKDMRMKEITDDFNKL